METYIDELLKKIIKRGYVMRNPYKPGAGTAPEFLAGRDKILNDATNILNELKDGGMAEHTIYFGVRGVGKTVLLNRIEEMAMNLGCLCTHNNKIITKTDAEIIKEEYRETLNNGFFGSRYNRATNKEKEFLYAMVECGRFPCSMTDVAIKMNKNVKSISPLRSHLLNKGLIYSPSFGEVDFTVPHFDKFLNREKFGV